MKLRDTATTLLAYLALTPLMAAAIVFLNRTK